MPLTRGLGLFAAGCLVAVAVVRLPWRIPEGGFAHLWLAQEAVAAACLTALFEAGRRLRPSPSRRDGAALALVALLAVEVVSGFGAQNPWAALRASGLVAVGAVAFSTGRRFGPRGLIAGLAVIAAVTLGVFLEALGLLPGASRYGHAPGGFLGERNAAAELLVIGLPCVAAFALGEPVLPRRLLALVLLGASTSAITICRTRSAWLSVLALVFLGVGLLGTDIRRGVRRAFRRAAPIAISLALGVLVAIVLPTRLRWTSATPFLDTARHLVDLDTASAAGRLVQYRTTLSMWAAHPLLGVGPGNWSGQYLAYAGSRDPTLSAAAWPVNRLPSSDLIGYLAERGSIGAFALAYLGWALLSGRDERRWLRRGSVLVLLPICTFDAALQLAPHLVLAAWILGGASSSSERHDTPAPRSELPSRLQSMADRVWRLSTVLLALLSCLAAVRVLAFWQLTHARNLDQLERSASLDPSDPARLLLVAEAAVGSGECERAIRLVALAAERSVETPAGREIRARCALRPQSSVRSE